MKVAVVSVFYKYIYTKTKTKIQLWINLKQKFYKVFWIKYNLAYRKRS